MRIRRRGKPLPFPALPSLALAPPEIRLANRSAMRAEWRDPTDTAPTAARTARTITGYRQFDPLRKARWRHGDGSSITERHIAAADILRCLADGACIGFSAPRDLSVPIQSIMYRPSTGPSRNAERQAKCWHRFVKAMTVFTRGQRELITLTVLMNTSVQRIAGARGANPSRLMGELVAVLDILDGYFASEVDEALSRGLAA